MYIVEPQSSDIIKFRDVEYTISEMNVSDSFKMQNLITEMQTSPEDSIDKLSKLLTPYLGGLAEKIPSMGMSEFNKVLEAYGSFISGSGEKTS